MNKVGMKHWVVPCSVLVAVGVKWATGLGSYSGLCVRINDRWAELTECRPKYTADVRRL
jgi:hypothetical protein